MGTLPGRRLGLSQKGRRMGYSGVSFLNNNRPAVIEPAKKH